MIRHVARWLRHAWCNICDMVGILACLAFAALVMPPVPVLMLYDDIRRMHEDG